MADVNPPANPYVGPRPFRTAEADRFFGRRREAGEIRSLWLSERVVVLHGPAAVGKTSLLNAGVLPLLAREDEVDLLPVGRIAHPTRPLAEPQPFNRYVYTLLRSWGTVITPPIGSGVVSSILQARAQRTDDDNLPFSLLAAIDHFEGLFTDLPVRLREQEEFIEELATALQLVPALKLLLVVRDDHLAMSISYEELLGSFTTFRLDALTPDAAEEAVTGPAVHTSRSYAAGVARQFVENMRVVTFTDLFGNTATETRQRVEPLHLQIACTRLWDSLPLNVEIITHERLQIHGDIGRVLELFYENAIRDVAGDHGLLEPPLRDWLESTFITEVGTRNSAYRGRSATANMPNTIADALVERHILVTERRFEITWYQLGQDQLIAAIRNANLRWRLAHGEQQQAAVPSGDYGAAAEAALGKGDFPAARRYASAAADRYHAAGDDRRHANALVLKADIARAQGDLKSAEATFRDALAQFSDLADNSGVAHVLSALAELRVSVGRYGAAADLQRQAIERLPGDIEALAGLGYAQWLDGSPADALVTFEQALSHNRNAPIALAGRGQVLVDLGRYEEAILDLRQALELGHQDEPDIRSALALAHAAIGQYHEADIELTIARRQEPGRARTLLRAARIALSRGQKRTARGELEAALRAQPSLSPGESEAARTLLAELGRES
jgi:tetratricopeptide (TPR) repeat protein